MNTKYVLVYITSKDKAEAKKIGAFLLKKRLAACVNVFQNMDSMYWWKGKIEEAAEAVLIVKTRRELAEKVIAAVKKLHSYQCPCVLALDVSDGNKDYLDWIGKETSI